MVLVLPPVEVLGFWVDCWRLAWEPGPPFENVEPTDPLELLIDEDILAEVESLVDPRVSSGRKSEDEDDGASVPTDDPTG